MDVSVLGAGGLGRDLAELAARAGHDVSLHDEEATVVMDAVDDVERRLAEAIDAGEATRTDRDETLERLDATTGLEAAVGDAELVIETAIATEGALQERFATLEELVARDAVLATTLEDSSVTVAAAGLRHPDRSIGLFVPDPLGATVVEVVVAEQTSRETLDRVESFVDGLDLEAAVVRDAPGLLSTRVALAAEVEAMRLVGEGLAGVEAVDAALTGRYDHPAGPLERADRAGLDRRLSTLEYLADGLGERFRPPPLLSDLVGSGHTGAESGQGFYRWENGEPVGSALPDPDVVERVAGPDDPAH